MYLFGMLPSCFYFLIKRKVDVKKGLSLKQSLKRKENCRCQCLGFSDVRFDTR